MANHFGDTSGPVGDIGNAVGPGFQQDELFLIDSTPEQLFSFEVGLNENSIGLLNQGHESRSREFFSRSVVGILWIAQMQERRKQERHAEPSRQAQAASDRPGIRESRGMDYVKMLRRPA